MQTSDSLQESLDCDIDCDALARDSDNEFQSTYGHDSMQNNQCHTQLIDSTDFSSDFRVQSVINSQILQQLQQLIQKIG